MDRLEILNRALAALNSRLPGEKAKIDFQGDTPHLTLMGKSYRCIIEPDISVGWLVEHCHAQNDGMAQTLYVTANASANVLDYSKASGINVLDCGGNFKLQYPDEHGGLLFLLANRGEKPVENINKSTIYPIFRDKGLKVLFNFLLDRSNIDRPFRDIQRATDVAIGTVKNIIDGLAAQRLARIEGRRRHLADVDRLLALWSANYAQSLKPKLLLTRMSFRSETARRDWSALQLPEGMYWGGEPAAALTDNYLKPGEFTIYTDTLAPALMLTRAVKPDCDGDILIYQKFWSGTSDANTVPAVLTYADLIESGNSRCIEAALKIKEHELKYLF